MTEITAAIDEAAANVLFDAVIANLVPPLAQSGSGSLGPFVASYSVTGQLSGGDVDLIPPDIIRVTDLRLDWHLDLSFGIDLGSFLPEFCLPQVCIRIPCVGRVCTPRICIDWPTITVPVSFGDFVRATADLRPIVSLTGGTWKVEAEIVGVPNLQFGATTAALLAAIGLAVTPILLAIPFIGPFLALAVNAILLAIGIAGITGLLGPILTPFISGLRIPIGDPQPRIFPVLPAESAVDPAVTITIDAVTATIANDGEDELIIGVDISA